MGEGCGFCPQPGPVRAVTDLECRRLHIIPNYLLFPASYPGCLGSADDGQRGGRWSKAAVNHHRFIVSKEQTIFLSVCLPPLASVGNRVMKASHLNDALWQQNPCMGFALRSLTSFKKMLTAFLPQHLLALFNHSGGRKTFILVLLGV